MTMQREIVQVSSGTGPVEVREFVARLAARMEELCDERGLTVLEVVSEGPEEAPLSVELHVMGGASAALASERGTHQLIARSARRGRAARKRWFAAVSIHSAGDPLEDTATLQIPEDQLVVTACRAGGKGGQHVNKVSTAVRVHHPASGVTVRVATERSQRQNLRIATLRIAEVIAAREAARLRKESAERRRNLREVVRGNAVRTYHLDEDGGLEVVA